MKKFWSDLTKEAQEAYLAYYVPKHAEWNGINVEEARKKLLVVLENLDFSFEIPNVPYEDTRSYTDTL